MILNKNKLKKEEEKMKAWVEKIRKQNEEIHKNPKCKFCQQGTNTIYACSDCFERRLKGLEIRQKNDE